MLLILTGSRGDPNFKFSIQPPSLNGLAEIVCVPQKIRCNCNLCNRCVAAYGKAMILRPANPADAEALAKLGRESFCAAFGALYRTEDLATFLQQAYSLDAVAHEIADPAITHCLAQDAPDGALTGYIKLTNPSPYGEYSSANRPLGLGQLYTDPARTGEGIGAALMEWALEQAQTGQHDAIQLSVWSENYGAQRFYARYGFGKIADIGFWVGQQRDEEFLYELRL